MTVGLFNTTVVVGAVVVGGVGGGGDLPLNQPSFLVTFAWSNYMCVSAFQRHWTMTTTLRVIKTVAPRPTAKTTHLAAYSTTWDVVRIKRNISKVFSKLQCRVSWHKIRWL